MLAMQDGDATVLGVQAEGLVKRYGAVDAVRGISFEVRRGEVFGLVGPNGAGKTTTVECLEGLRVPDAGTIRILGLDPIRDRRLIASRTGVQLQDLEIHPRARAGELVELFATLYDRVVDAGGLLESLGLGHRIEAAVHTLSGGERRRLSVALALVNDADLLFLDELTTGMDPQGRRDMWSLVRRARAGGAGVVLTTQFMEEAEALCDRVAVLVDGAIVALDAPQALVRSVVGATRVTMRSVTSFDAGILGRIGGVVSVTTDGDVVTAHVVEAGVVAAIVNALADAGVAIRDLSVDRATLEDAFLRLASDDAGESKEAECVVS